MALIDDLNKLFDGFIPIIRDAFKAAIADVVNRAILVDVQRAIQSGDVEAAFRALGFSDAAMRPLSKAIEDAFEQGGVTVGASFPGRLDTPTGRAVFRFDVRNSRAEEWLRNESSTLITRIEENTRNAVRTAMFEGVKAGRNGRSIAYDLVGRLDENGNRTGGIVGLTNNAQAAVFRARQELNELNPAYFRRERRDKRFDGIVQRAITNGKPLTQVEIDKITGRYSNSLLLLRGETIGRTEAHAALQRSEWEAVKQAVDMGSLKASAVQRIWDNASDFRVRHSHRLMEGQKVGLDEPFKSPVTGSLMMYPGDTSLGADGEETINCRCRSRLKVDWLAGVK